MDVETAPRIRTAATRWLPLAGVAFAALQVAGNLTIGPFPDEETSTGEIADFYAAHHAQVYAGGRLLELSAVFLAFFGVALWVALRESAPVVAAAVLVGGTMSAVDAASSGATYAFLGDLGVQHNVTPEALQAWHVAGAGLGGFVGDVVLLLAVAAAGIGARALPRWIGWTALVLAAAHLTPFGFFASLVFLLWAAAAGIALLRRSTRVEKEPATESVNVG